MSDAGNSVARLHYMNFLTLLLVELLDLLIMAIPLEIISRREFNNNDHKYDIGAAR